MCWTIQGKIACVLSVVASCSAEMVVIGGHSVLVAAWHCVLLLPAKVIGSNVRVEGTIVSFEVE